MVTPPEEPELRASGTGEGRVHTQALGSPVIIPMPSQQPVARGPQPPVLLLVSTHHSGLNGESKGYIHVLPPGTCEWASFGKGVFADAVKVKD